MPAKAAARKTDPTSHPGVIGSGCLTVMIEKLPAARVGDVHGCYKSASYVMATGSMTVKIGGKPACRVGDLADCTSAVVKGALTVFIGD